MLHVGFAETDITPKPGSQSPGGMNKRVLTAVLDRLKAVAMVVNSGDAAVALVGIDALFITAETTARARAAIEKGTKIRGDHVLIGASHTHSGGPVASCFECDADPDYLVFLGDKIAEAVVTAWSRLHDAEIGRGVGHEPAIAFNRRFLMRDGRQVTHPGKRNPQIVRSAGPIDPDVGVLAARAPGGQLMGLFVNFACHLTIGRGNGFSADYVFNLRETLREHFRRPDLPVGFLLGAAGDVTQVDNLRPGREFGPEWAEFFGLALGAETIQAVERIEWKKEASVASVRTVVPIPIRSEEEVKRQGPALGLGSGAGADTIYERERELVAKERVERPIVDCEVQAIRIGDLGIASNGAEFFCALGLDVKSASPFPATWVVSLANDWIGYVPTPSAYYAGGYEPRTARSAKLAPWAGQALVEGSLAALDKVKT
jgi:neutral ceramidase